MKKWGILLLTLLCVTALCLPLAGCADQPAEQPDPSQTTTTTEPEGMTEEKAIALACQHWGVRNGETIKDAQHVQRMVEVTVVSAPTEDHPYYVVLLSQQQSNGTWASLETVKLDGETGAVIKE